MQEGSHREEIVAIRNDINSSKLSGELFNPMRQISNALSIVSGVSVAN